MKRIIFIFFAAMMSTAVCSAAMSNSKVRKETRFLTDKMAYELNLSTEQYNDVYEINYDFISGIRYLMDDVLRGDIAVAIIVRTITTAIIAVVTIIRTIPVRGVFGMISRTTPAAVQISVR